MSAAKKELEAQVATKLKNKQGQTIEIEDPEVLSYIAVLRKNDNINICRDLTPSSDVEPASASQPAVGLILSNKKLKLTPSLVDDIPSVGSFSIYIEYKDTIPLEKEFYAFMIALICYHSDNSLKIIKYLITGWHGLVAKLNEKNKGIYDISRKSISFLICSSYYNIPALEFFLPYDSTLKYFTIYKANRSFLLLNYISHAVNTNNMNLINNIAELSKKLNSEDDSDILTYPNDTILDSIQYVSEEMIDALWKIKEFNNYVHSSYVFDPSYIKSADSHGHFYLLKALCKSDPTSAKVYLSVDLEKRFEDLDNKFKQRKYHEKLQIQGVIYQLLEIIKTSLLQNNESRKSEFRHELSKRYSGCGVTSIPSYWINIAIKNAHPLLLIKIISLSRILEPNFNVGVDYFVNPLHIKSTLSDSTAYVVMQAATILGPDMERKIEPSIYSFYKEKADKYRLNPYQSTVNEGCKILLDALSNPKRMIQEINNTLSCKTFFAPVLSKIIAEYNFKTQHDIIEEHLEQLKLQVQLTTPAIAQPQPTAMIKDDEDEAEVTAEQLISHKRRRLNEDNAIPTPTAANSGAAAVASAGANAIPIAVMPVAAAASALRYSSNSAAANGNATQATTSSNKRKAPI